MKYSDKVPTFYSAVADYSLTILTYYEIADCGMRKSGILEVG